ncbi:putative dipeptidyl-aminopeptidase B [Cryomyces minteri]|uniref:dipeptidyl-peptidase IV n=1 Tax=Cryomyces minteri TaxID=331657 RepID=A0A4V5NAM5_9PEZI|nr:putative dipeptidyl-aminopeptidase B [Cryomyces minteri]
MAKEHSLNEDETHPLTNLDPSPRSSVDEPQDSVSSASTTSLVLEHLSGKSASKPKTGGQYTSRPNNSTAKNEVFDVEEGGPYYGSRTKPVDRGARRYMWIVGILATVGWLIALVLFVGRGTYKHVSTRPHDPWATGTIGSGKKVTLDQVLSGTWRPRAHAISWIAGVNGEDGLLLEQGGGDGRDYLVVEDIRHRDDKEAAKESITLMKKGGFYVGKQWVWPYSVWPSADQKKVLVMSNREHNWRHSFTGWYWIFDVASQTAEALDPPLPQGRIQLASWSPQSDAIVFTRDNHMFIRKLSSDAVTQITMDGGSELFYGVPDWVYEEEVLSGNSATWWSEDGKHVAYYRTNESLVPEYPVQYFLSRPSGTEPLPGQENYPEVRQIKYPKAGAPNPVVHVQFYDVEKKEVFAVKIDGDFADNDRLITEVVWAGHSGKVLVRETNRESDVLKVILIDVQRRTGNTVRETDVKAIDGGWFEVSETTTYVPSDPANGRPHDGYIDTVIYEGYDHMAYFTPMDNPKPLMLTTGKWEVVKAPSAVDLKNNLVYFVATKESSIQRHVYSVKMDGTDLKPITNTNMEGYYDVSFSKRAGSALLTYSGPNIPWQKVISTPSNTDNYEILIEANKDLAALASAHELPIKIYQTVNIDGFELNVVERRPPHFDESKRYPVLFYLYNGPGFQEVSKKFAVDFQAYVASSLGYIVVTLDGRGTGYLGRETRCITRGNIGHYEAHDQIETAKLWAAKKYVDEERIAIWGWSYGGFMTLKTLEVDAGRTFRYGMSVAPVTDWRFYDSIYTERYMHTPQNNPSGYNNATISNVTALGQNVRFLMMHGVADDNVHMQNSLTLLDKLDLAGVENYDFHAFPDSDHGIYFHNANKMVYDQLSNWLVNAFNGEWLKTEHPTPMVHLDGVSHKR